MSKLKKTIGGPYDEHYNKGTFGKRPHGGILATFRDPLENPHLNDRGKPHGGL